MDRPFDDPPPLRIGFTKTGRVIEYVDHLHGHFVDPCIIRNAAYMHPQRAGFSIAMTPASIAANRFQQAKSPVDFGAKWTLGTCLA